MNTLNGKQCQIYDAVVSHYQQTLQADLDSQIPVPRQLWFQAGTGKSHIIWIFSSQLLEDIAAAHG